MNNNHTSDENHHQHALSVEAKLQETWLALTRQRDEAKKRALLAAERLRLRQEEVAAAEKTVHSLRERIQQLKQPQGTGEELAQLEKEVAQSTQEAQFQHEELMQKRQKVQQVRQQVALAEQQRQEARSQLETLLQKCQAQLQAQEAVLAQNLDDQVKQYFRRRIESSPRPNEASLPTPPSGTHHDPLSSLHLNSKPPMSGQRTKISAEEWLRRHFHDHTFSPEAAVGVENEVVMADQDDDDDDEVKAADLPRLIRNQAQTFRDRAQVVHQECQRLERILAGYRQHFPSCVPSTVAHPILPRPLPQPQPPRPPDAELHDPMMGSYETSDGVDSVLMPPPLPLPRRASDGTAKP